MACLLWYPTCSGGTTKTVDFTEGARCPLLVLWVGFKPWWWLHIAGASTYTPGSCMSFTPAVIAGRQSEGFLPMYTSLSKMPCTTCSQDSSGPSSGDAPVAKTPSNMPHMSFCSLVRSPKTMQDMALPRILSWGLADLLWRQYHISTMVSTLYTITHDPSMSSVSMWAYMYAISSNRKRNIFR